MKPIENVLERLDRAKRNGSGWVASCPCPDHGQRRGDKNPSLTVDETEDGRVLIRCHVGCPTEEIVHAIGITMKDLFPPKPAPAPKLRPKPTGLTLEQYAAHVQLPVEYLEKAGLHDATYAGRPAMAIPYRAADGNIIETKYRTGLGHDFRWPKGKPLMPYGLPGIEDARRRGFCILVEGESDTHVLRNHGFPVIGIPGANAWNDAWTDSFDGIPKLYVMREPDSGGDTLVAKLARSPIADRCLVATLGDKLKDARELHLAFPEILPGMIEAALEAAVAIEAVNHGTQAPRTDGPSPADYGHVTDAANAARLHELHGDALRYVAKWNAWLVWTGTRWELDDKATLVGERAKDVGRTIVLEELSKGDTDSKLMKHGLASLGAGRIKGMIELARGLPGILLDHEALDADPWLLGVRNGVVDLRTGGRRPADPNDLMTMQAPVSYSTGAAAPRWDRALAEWFPDLEVRDYVQRIVGAALVGEQRDHVFVIHYGLGANGKGTFVRAITTALGAYAVTPHMTLLVNTRATEHDTVKATLFRARLAVASETARRVTLAEASVKNLTGRDRISCRRLYENPWEFEPSHSLWLQTNHLPRITGRDHGIWRRIRVVPWTEKFKPATEDLDAMLAAEAPGILRWAVEGTQRWQEHGLAEPQAVLDATLKYRQTEDVFARFQADTGLTFGPGSTSVASLNARFKAWAEEQDIKPRMGELRDWLLENGADQIRDGKQRTRMYHRVTIPAETP